MEKGARGQFAPGQGLRGARHYGTKNNTNITNAALGGAITILHTELLK